MKMLSVLEPLVQIPGVRIALLVGTDGVPVVARNSSASPSDSDGIDENTDALAALASGLVLELTGGATRLSSR